MVQWSRLLLVLACVTGGAPALAVGPLWTGRTVVVLCQEAVDNTAAPVCTLESSLLDWLKQEGARTVDPAQVERIRRQMSPEKWANPAELKGVDLMDAEFAMVVVTRGTSQMAVGKMKSYLVQVTLRVVDVSRGTVVHQVDLSGNGLGLNANAALQQGVTMLWMQKSAGFRSGLEAALAAPQPQDVWVYDVADLDAVTRAEEQMRSVPGVTGLTRTAFTKNVARWRLVLPNGMDAGAFARALEGADSPLAVQGLTGGVLQVAWRPLGRVRLPVRVTVKNAPKVPAWFSRASVDLAQRQLKATGWAREAQGKDSAIDVTVETGPAAKGYAVRVSARAGKKPPLGAALETGTEADLPAAQQRALDKALGDVWNALQRNPGEYADIMKALANAAPLQAQLALDTGPLRVLDGERWASDGVGSVTLNQTVDELTLRVRLGESAWANLSPQRNTTSARVLLPVDLAPWRSLARATSAQLEVEATARAGERLHRFTLGRAVMVYPTRAMAWDQPESFAAYIQPTAAWARALAQAAASPDARLPTPVTARLAAVWDALQAHGLRYQPDPVAPFGSAQLDTVNLPPETLGAGGGDCDDLTALVATAFEAAGQATVVLKLPRHVMLAVDSGLPFSAWPMFFSRQQQAVQHQGRLFLPVESTAVGRSFWDATRDAGERLAGLREPPLVMDPRARWATHPPLEQLGDPLGSRPREPRVRVMVLQFAANKEWESAARVAARETAVTLARNPALEVITEEQVADMATLQRAQMLSGCDAKECTTDLGRALAVRAVLGGRLDLLGGKPLLNMTLQDVSSMTVEAAQSIPIKPEAFDASTVAVPANAMVQTYLQRRVPKAAPGSRWEDRQAQLERDAAKDPFALTRLYVFLGRTDDAVRSMAAISDPKRRALAQGNVALLSGRMQEAQAAWQPLDALPARVNSALAHCSVQGGDACSRAAAGLNPVQLKTMFGVDDRVDTAGADGAEAAIQTLGRAVVEASQGRAGGGVDSEDAALARRWMLQW